MTAYIKGLCHTNLDGYERAKWPTLFVSVPLKGDYVQSQSGDISSRILKVCGITHRVGVDDVPYILIELNK